MAGDWKKMIPEVSSNLFCDSVKSDEMKENTELPDTKSRYWNYFYIYHERMTWLSISCNLIKRKFQPFVCVNYCIIQSILKNLYTTCIFFRSFSWTKLTYLAFVWVLAENIGTAAPDWIIMQLSLTSSFSTQKEIIWHLLIPFFLQLLLLNITKYPAPKTICLFLLFSWHWCIWEKTG